MRVLLVRIPQQSTSERDTISDVCPNSSIAKEIRGFAVHWLPSVEKSRLATRLSADARRVVRGT
jgi:hypothetical protein